MIIIIMLLLKTIIYISATLLRNILKYEAVKTRNNAGKLMSDFSQHSSITTFII